LDRTNDKKGSYLLLLDELSENCLEEIIVSKSAKLTNDAAKWKQKIYDWLAEEGMFRKEVDDPKAGFHFGINYPVGSPYHIEIVKPRDMKDGVLIVSILRVAPSRDAVQFQVRLLDDNLSKTTLLEAIDDVFRSMLFVIWTFGHHFGMPTEQPQQPGFYA